MNDNALVARFKAGVFLLSTFLNESCPQRGKTNVNDLKPRNVFFFSLFHVIELNQQILRDSKLMKLTMSQTVTVTQRMTNSDSVEMLMFF